jgi:glycosyltransferase involved in cell wall biosynthesis
MFLRRRAMVILTVSEFSKQELVDCVHIDPWKVSVISEAADNIQTIQSDEGVFAKYDIGRKPYILAVGSLSPHKNIQGVISGMAMISEQLCDLVIVGKKNKRVFNSYELPLRAGVKWVNHVSDEELKALYQRAVCLVYPSFYEGFGFPPLEAMTCGCPVIVSNVASLPEVCGDAALYCNPNNPDDIIEKVMTVLQNSNFHKELSMRGIIRSSNFSWKKTARETWQAIENKIF